MRWSFLNRAFSTFVFYLGWIICLNEASIEHSYYGVIIVVAFMIYYLYCSSCRKADYSLLAFVLLIGPLSDLLYAQIGLLEYHSVYTLSSWAPPPWVFILWGLFGVNIHLFSWLKHHIWITILLGAIGGPASYLSVIKLGGASALKPLPFTLMAIGGVWAVFFPFFIEVNDYLRKKFS